LKPINPATGEVIATFEHARSTPSLDAAVESAKKGKKSWAAIEALFERGDPLKKQLDYWR